MHATAEPRTQRAASRPGPRPGSVAATLVGAAVLAWMPTAQAPAAAHGRTVPSYATMARSLTQLYPASRAHAIAIVTTVHQEADRHALDPCLVMAVIAKESAFLAGARNRRDVGLMQLNLDWHRDRVVRAGGPDALLDPVRNVRAGTELLAHYRTLAGGEHGALRRYNGLGKRNDYVQRVRAEASRLEAAGTCIGTPPALAAQAPALASR